MRYLISCLLLGLLTFGLTIDEASAGRFGGGRSFGVQRSHSSLFSHQPSQGSQFFQKKPNTGRWGSALGGLLVGSLFASLLMGHGLGAGLFSWLMLGLVIFAIVGFLKKRAQPAFQSTQAPPFQQQSFQQSSQYYTSNAQADSTSYPPGFVPESFLRAAKVTFIRLQTAYDQKNLQDLNEFTAPDVFAEIKMQLDERGHESNKTDIINLDAKLLDASKQANSTIASVHFTGFIKENDEAMTALDEIWHFRQFANNTHWVVAGIQQEVVQPR